MMKKHFPMMMLLAALLVPWMGQAQTIVEIGSGTTTSNYLPSYNYFNYSFSQQIYTATEIGSAGSITSVAFKNTGAEKTRTYNIYMANTSKESFTSTSDWESMSATDLVYSGTITFSSGQWTTIQLSSPFVYDGVSNLIISCADVTGSYSNSPHMANLTFSTGTTYQALYAYRDTPGAYDPTNPSVSGTRSYSKNQIQLEIISGGNICLRPTLAMGTLTNTEATITWDPVDDAASYIVTLLSGTTELATEVVSDTAYIFDTLTPATSYTVQVSTLCATGDTSRAATINFTTLLAMPASLPYFTSFEEGDDVSWSFANDDDNQWFIGTAAKSSGSKGLYISNDNGVTNSYTSQTNYSFAWRSFLLVDTGEYGINFDWRCTGESSYDYMSVFLAPASAADPVAGSSSTTGWMAVGPTIFNQQETWENYLSLVHVSQPGTYSVIFRWKDDSSVQHDPPAAVDNISIMKITCPAVASLRIDSTDWTTTTTTIAWTYDEEFDGTFDYRYADSAFNPNMAGIEGSSNDTIAPLSDLQPGTRYWFYVRPVCGAGDTGFWSSAISFYTDCAPIPSTDIPFVETFDDWTEMNPCWKRINSNNSSYLGLSTVTSNPDYTTPAKGLRLYPNSTNVHIISMPELENLNGLSVGFWMRGSDTASANATGIDFGVMSNPADSSTFELIENFPVTLLNTWEYHQVDLSSYTGSGRFVSFRGHRANSSASYLYLDNITVMETPACARPDAIAVRNITADSAVLFIDDPTTVNNYSIKLIWQSSDTTIDTISLTANDTVCQMSNLHANTVYRVMLTSVCASGEENQPNYTFFRTECAPVEPLPWSENFESYSSGNGNRPMCWDVLAGYTSGTTEYPYISATAHSSSRSYYLYSTSTYPNVVATPLFNAPANQLHITLWARSNSSGNLTIGLLTDSTMTSFIPLTTIGNGGDTWKEYEFYTDTVNFTGNARLAFQWVSRSTTGYACYLDDIRVELATDCRRPMNTVVTHTDYDGATLAWTDNSGVSRDYLVRYAKHNNINDSTLVDTVFQNTIVTLTGLESNTTYYAWVATLCDNDTTAWRAFSSFTTKNDCYSIQNASVSDITNTAAVLTWTYNTNDGREATGAIVTIVDNTVATALDTLDDWDATLVEGNYAFLTGLTEGHKYQVTLKTACDTFRAAATTVNFETQTCGQIRGNATSSLAPLAGYYNYSYSQNLYTASELMGLGEITGIAFRQASVPSNYLSRPVKVWMANTNKTSLDTNDYVALSELSLLYDSTLNLSTVGWDSIVFDSTFTWDGHSNLVIAVQNLTGNYSSFNWGAHTSTTGNSVYWYRDADTVTASNPNALTASASSINRAKSTTMPDITFFGDCTPADCGAPMTVIASASASSVTLQWQAGASENSYIVEYKLPSDTVWTTAETEVTSTTYEVTGLDANTYYMFRVGSLCGDDTLYGTVRSTHTACGGIELPYVESFEGWNSGVFPACWYKVLPFNSYPSISTTHLDGAGSLYISGTNAMAMVASPEVPSEPDNLKVTFWANGATPSNHNLKAGVMTDPEDYTTFVECTVSPTGVSRGNWSEYEFYTDNVEIVDSNFSNVHVAFYWQMSSVSSGYIDSVAITTAGSCRKPNTPRVKDVTYYNATLKWNDINNGSANYEIRYSTVNDVDTTIYAVETSSSDSVRLNNLHNGTTYYAWIRNVCEDYETEWVAFPAFNTLISCYPVQNLTFVGSTFNTAAIQWEYNITQGMSPQGAVVSLKDVTGDVMVFEDIEVEGTSYVFTDLVAAHNYVVYINTVCDPDSSAAVQLAFNTQAPPCGEVTGTSTTNSYIPFYTLYNYGYSQALYPASALVNLDTITAIAYTSNTASSYPYTFDVYLGHTSLTALSTTSYVPYDSLTLVAQNYVFSTIEQGENIIIFDTPFAYNGDSNLVVVVDNNTGSWHSTVSWESHSAPASGLRVYGDGTNYNPATVSGLTLQDTRPNIKFYGNCGLDNLCTAPLLVVDDVTTSSITLRWGSDNADQYTLQYRRYGDTTWTDALVGTSLTDYTISDLSSSMQYQVRLGGYCDDTTVVYSATILVRTFCGTIDLLPFTENFESFNTGSSAEFDPCWSKGTNSTSVYPYVNGDNSNKYMYFYNSSSSYYAYLITPAFDESINFSTLELSFDARKYNATSYTAHLIIGMTDSDAYAPSAAIDTLAVYDFTNTDFMPYELNLSGYQGNKHRLIFVSKGTSSSSNYVYLDNIDLHVAPACAHLQGVSVSNVTATSAEVTITDTANVGSYRLVLSDGLNTDTIDITSTTHTLNNLNAATRYTLVAATICSDGSVTRSYSTAFNTLMVAVTVPYSTGFEAGEDCAWLTANGTNGWYVGSATHSGATGTNALYISKDNGASHTYTTSATSYSYAYKLFTLTASDYVISYDWHADGESNYDYLRVALAPGSTSISNSDMGFTTSAVPAGWTALDGGSQLNLSSDWSTVSDTFSVATAGEYLVVFFWKNDQSQGTNPPAAVDNIDLSLLLPPAPPCETPTNIHTTALDSTSATLDWTSDAASWKLSVNNGADVAVTTKPHRLTGLIPNTQYSVRVKAVCEDGSESGWATYSFRTLNGPGNPDDSTGIADVYGADIKLFPNPASTTVTLAGIEGNASVVLVDLNGREAGKWNVSDGTLTIDLDGMPRGAYFVRIVGEKSTAIRKLIVQ